MVAKLLMTLLIATIVYCGKLPIQAHSFNDFNYLQNLINKGVDYFKLDVSMANRKSCQEYSTWNKSKKCYRTSQYVEQICCLAFRGDASSRPSFNYHFNTSEEYIAFMTNNLAKIVTYEPKRRLLFAINFQYEHSFHDFITEQFLIDLADLMSKYPHNLLLGTGSDNFILEYDRICYGKGAPECTDDRRKISKSNLFLQSGAHNPFDPRDHYKRFRNYNIYYKGIQSHCQNGFPEWINTYPQFPMIFWEPSNQKQIQFVLSHFLSPSCMKKHGRNLSGMAVATNIDIQMFDIYSKKLTQPKMINLKSDDTSDSTSFQYMNEKLFITEQRSLKITKQLQGPNQIVFSASVNAYLTNKLILQRWQSDSKTKTIRLAASREHTSVIKQGEKLSSILNDGIGHVILITETLTNNQFNNIFYFSNTTFELVSFKAWPKIYGSFMKKDELVYLTCQDSTLTDCSIKGAIQLKQTKTYATFFANSFLSKITSLQEYEGGFIIVGQSSSKKDLSAALIIRQGQVFPPQIPLSLGTDAKIFKKESGKKYGVLLSNGMCHSALLINNNDMNKCNFFESPQFSSLRNVRGIVNLIQFDIQDLLKSRQIISPCSPKISLSKIMNGANSDILEMPSLGSYLVVSQYVRIEDQDMVAALFCGGSNFDKSFQYREKSSIMATFNLSNQQDKLNNEIDLEES